MKREKRRDGGINNWKGNIGAETRGLKEVGGDWDEETIYKDGG